MTNVMMHLADLTNRKLRVMGLHHDRRKSIRIRLTETIPARLGTIEAALNDISAGGARLRHKPSVTVGAEATFRFMWADHWFRALARVVASHIIHDDPNGDAFETRVEFIDVPPESVATLARTLATLNNRQLREWVGNLLGDVARPRESHDQPLRLLRFRPLTNGWQVRSAKLGEKQPVDGFILPASFGEEELRVVCAAYRQLNCDGQALLRLFAQMTLREMA